MFISKPGFKEKMRGGQAVFGAEVSLGVPIAAELMAMAGFDFVQVDCQHGMWTDATAMAAFHHTLLGGSVPTARVEWNDHAAIGRLLDRGCMGIIVPMVNDREEAERAAAAVRYPPHGGRSTGAPVAMGIYGPEYKDWIDDEVFLGVQIETADGLANVREILSVEGVDGCMIGPGDLSKSMGLDLKKEVDVKRHREAIRHIYDVCVEVGKIPGIATGGKGAKPLRDQGFKFILSTGDFGMVAQGSREFMEWITT